MAVRTPSETIDAAESAGIAKNSRPLGRLLAGSALAGAYIALGGTLSLIIGFGFPALRSPSRTSASPERTGVSDRSDACSDTRR